MGGRAHFSLATTFRAPQGKTNCTTSSVGDLDFTEKIRLGRYYVPAFSKLRVQIVRPPLHHRSTLLQILRMIVGCGHLVPLHVGELQLNVRLFKTVFIENGRCQSTKSMPVMRPR